MHLLNMLEVLCLLFGAEHMERLSRSHVLVVGLGGVGAYAAEQICRAGVGKMTIIDADTVNESNINRQLPALHSTLGMPKAEVVAKRLLDINPQLQLTVLNEFLRDERTEEVLLSAPLDFVVDAIDIPAGVEVKIEEGNKVTVKGPKGTLEKCLPVEMTIKQEDNQVVVTRPNDLKKTIVFGARK